MPMTRLFCQSFLISHRHFNFFFNSPGRRRIRIIISHFYTWKMKKYFSIAAFSLLLLTACSDKKNIASSNDYIIFLNQDIIKKEEERINEERSFWQQRLQRDTGNFVDMMKLASVHLRLFKLKGEINDLHAGDSLLKASAAKLGNNDPDILFAISHNSIAQHRFRDAALYNESAQKVKGDMYTVRSLEFDANMELGLYQNAARSLATLKDKSSFDYLIRRAKLEDHKGNLNEAIEWMEQAFEKVKYKDKSLYCWAMSNLGDMYGHAGRIQESYDAYLDVLRKDSSYFYALKGIAWIAYSHDKNTAEAKRILHFILSQTKMPVLWLTLAEIEEWEGNEVKKNEYVRIFLDEIEKPGYGDMYNKYLIEIYLEELKDPAKALAIAEKEVNNRTTPETFDWLAWVFYKQGENEKAFSYAKNNVKRQIFEPNAVLHTALIFSANGKKKEARLMLKECLESSFELGPIQTRKIKRQLASM